MKVNSLIGGLAFLASGVAALRTVDFFSSIDSLYFPIIFGFMLLLLLVRPFPLRIDPLQVLLVLAIWLSILLNDIPGFFSAEQRFIAFLMIILFTSPLVRTKHLDQMRLKAFYLFSVICVIVSVVSLGAYLFRLPFAFNNTGFTGIFTHSMVLSPIAGIAAIYMVRRVVDPDASEHIVHKCLLLLVAAAVCALSGSRTAILASMAAIFVFFLYFYQFRISRYFKVIAAGLVLIAMMAPFMGELAQAVLWKTNFALERGDIFYSRQQIWTNRIDEFMSSPIFGVGFGRVIAITDFDQGSGVVEPGSGWLAILSMTGVIGFLVFLLVVIIPTIRLLRGARTILKAHILATMVFHACMLISEGYVFAAGSTLFFNFWLALGAATATTRPFRHYVPGARRPLTNAHAS